MPFRVSLVRSACRGAVVAVGHVGALYVAHCGSDYDLLPRLQKVDRAANGTRRDARHIIYTYVPNARETLISPA